METIQFPVGIRNGVSVMPNISSDVQTICSLLDRVPPAQGGTANNPGAWPMDGTRIQTVTSAIINFQTANALPTVDGVVDPNGATLTLMNQLAGPAPVQGVVAYPDPSAAMLWRVVDPTSVDGTDPLVMKIITPTITRYIVMATGSSITWFGVVVPRTPSGGIVGGSPHIFFTPLPSQHPCFDQDYNQFVGTSWFELWDRYTGAIGSQLVQSQAPQILVIPFYKNSQWTSLGDFLTNWQSVVSAVVTAVLDDIDPMFLRDTYNFNSIFTSSFSNGIFPHANFSTAATGAAAMTQMIFDLDGQAARPQSSWHPSPATIYKDLSPPFANPTGTTWYVGGRWGAWSVTDPGTFTHNLCPLLMLHGLSRFARVM